MISIQGLWKALGVGSCVAILAACAHHDVKKATISSTASPSDEIARMESAIQEARNQEVNLLSPQYFEKSEKSLNEAKEDYQDKESNKEILENVAYSEAYLDKAREVASRSQKDLTPVMDARKAAVNAKADAYFPKRLKNADEDLVDLTEDYEKDGDQATAKQMKKLQDEYVDIETDALKAGYLGQAKSLIDKAKDNRAKKYVPQTLEKAEAAYQNAEKVIESDRNNQARVTEAVDLARGQAERVFELTAVAKNAEGQSPEQMALAIEKRTRELDAKTAALNANLAQGQSTRAALNASEADLAKNESELNRLKTKEQFQNTINQSRQLFSKEEADVYQQGNNLLIRLKSVNFPSNRAEIPSQSVSTLEKVKEVMSQLTPGQVVVEGHTDSVGAADVNMKLSEARAEAIKKYLVSQSAVSEEIVETKGLGYEHPISSNKTKAGRAQNRRVDIVISPEGSTVQ